MELGTGVEVAVTGLRKMGRGAGQWKKGGAENCKETG